MKLGPCAERLKLFLETNLCGMKAPCLESVCSRVFRYRIRCTDVEVSGRAVKISTVFCHFVAACHVKASHFGACSCVLGLGNGGYAAVMMRRT
jgi:hypothetical protein